MRTEEEILRKAHEIAKQKIVCVAGNDHDGTIRAQARGYVLLWVLGDVDDL